MVKATSATRWQRTGEEEITLTGAWTLLLDAPLRRRLAEELGALRVSDGCRWNLRGIEALDSAGARVLWEVWRGAVPANLDCDPDHLHWFRWLADTRVVAAPSRSWLDAAIARVRGGAAGLAQAIAGIFLLAGQLLLDLGYWARHPREIAWKEISATIYQMGATSMLLLGFVGFLIGVVMTIQIGLALQQFGAALMIVQMMGIAVLRELGPVVCGIILAGRSGSAITAGIGAMHLTGEYDALRAFGSAPSRRLALPRVIGAIVALPLLVVWTDFAALIGGAVTAQANLGVGVGLFLARLPEQVQIVNFWIGLVKGAVFGLTIALIGCYAGMTAPPDTAGMSRNTTLSVVASLTLILLIDAASGALLTHVGLF